MKKSILDSWQSAAIMSCSRGCAGALRDTANSPKSAFTLAEVLIVLGVIGIVAALTIPALLKNWQEDRWVVENDVFKNRLNQAVSQMHARARLTTKTTTEGFVDDLKNFMKMTRTCSVASNCFVAEFKDGETSVNATDFNTIDNFGHSDWGTATMGMTLANGANLILAYNPNCKTLDPAAVGVEVAACSVAALYDTNGNGGPNEIGRDIHFFNRADIAQGPDIPCRYITAGGGICWVHSGDINVPVWGGNAPLSLNTFSGSAQDKALDPRCNTNSPACTSNYWAAAKNLCKSAGFRLPTQSEWNEVYDQWASAGFYQGLNINWTSDDSAGDGTKAQTISHYKSNGQKNYGSANKNTPYDFVCVK